MTAAISRAALPFLATAALLLAGAGLSVLALSKIEALVDDAATSARAERDAHWTAEIERISAITNRKIADQAKAALAIETDANARVRDIELQLATLEKENAALPDGDACGLRRDRVRLLAR